MRQAFRATLETVLVHGLLGWLYVAAVAAARPSALSVPISSLLPVRRDTFGTACFALSALAATLLHTATGRWWQRTAPRPGAGPALLRTGTVHGLLVWAYLCVNSLTHPETLARPLTHFADAPREGQTASWAFAVTALTLLLARAQARPDRSGGDPA
ncbi:hypothetical protein ACIHEJ_01185 [Streptomyces sp. NPDC052301]|uniref:hypothetical protein n=1 Tax=Streptomyces sp. NPDC052301 TaxID=3365687 RepID=UPI0037CF2DD0